MTAVEPPARPILPGPVVTLLGLAAGTVVLAGMRAAAGVIGPVVLAMVIGAAASGLRERLARRLPGWVATVATLGLTFLGIAGFVLAVAVSVSRFAGTLPDYRADLERLLEEVRRGLATLGVGRDQVESALHGADPQHLVSLTVSLLLGLASAMSNLVFVLALLFFLVVDAGGTGRRMGAVAVIRPAVAERIREVNAGIRRYLWVTTVFGLIVAGLDTVYLLVLGIPHAYLWGLLAFVTGYIPNVGLVIGMIPPAAIGLLDGGRPDDGVVVALAVVIGYLVINNVLQSGIQPKFVSDALQLSLTVSFLSLVLWSFVLGPVGALLAIPLTLFARAVLVDAEPRHTWLAILAGDRPPPEEEVERLRAAVERGRAG
jgi:predicted PurR-regulated permease PerM